MTTRGKNENEDEKIQRNESNFLILHIKINVAIFMKTQEKNFLTHFLRKFLTNRGKNENEDDKIWKNEFNF